MSFNLDIFRNQFYIAHLDLLCISGTVTEEITTLTENPKAESQKENLHRKHMIGATFKHSSLLSVTSPEIVMGRPTEMNLCLNHLFINIFTVWGWGGGGGHGLVGSLIHY